MPLLRYKPIAKISNYKKPKASYFAVTGFSKYGAELGFEPYIGTLQTISLKVRI
ncbi:hypothetical protein J8L86_03680 [Shewanella sp. MMG014]|nr:hypothetical protein [Shewanella sp. MMG014]